MEAVGTGADLAEDQKVHQTIWYDFAKTHPKESHDFVLPAKAGPTTDWHTYTVEWTPADSAGWSTVTGSSSEPARPPRGSTRPSRDRSSCA